MLYDGNRNIKINTYRPRLYNMFSDILCTSNHIKIYIQIFWYDIQILRNKGEKEGGIHMLSEVITNTMLSGVLDEIVGLLPVCLPVMITFIALRKGIAFVQSILHSA